MLFHLLFYNEVNKKNLRFLNFLLKDSAENVYLFAELGTNRYFLLIAVICYLLPLLESNSHVLENTSNDVKSKNWLCTFVPS